MTTTVQDAQTLGAALMQEELLPPGIGGNGQPQVIAQPAVQVTEPQPPMPALPELPQPPVPSAMPAPPTEHVVRVDVAQPPAKRTRAPAAPKDPGALPATVQAKVNKVMGTTDKLRFRKRDTTGDLHLIRDYDMAALKSSQYDPETFIQRYLLPAHGEGGYVVEFINGKGDAVSEKEYSVLNPSKVAPVAASTPGGQPQEFVDRMWARMEKLEEAARQPPPQQTDPLTMMRQLKELTGGQDAMMPMMLMMMQQGQQPPANPVAGELASMKAEMARAMQPTPVALPPLPPPGDQISGKDLIDAMQANKGPGISEIIGVVATLLPAIKEIFGGNKDAEREITRLRDEASNQRIGTLIDELKEIKNKPARGIQETLAETQAMFQFAQTVAGSDGPNFWSVAEAAVANIPETTAGLSALVDKMKESEEEKRMLTQQRMAPQPQAKAELPKKGGEEIEFPEGFAEACAKIEEAGDDPGDQIQAIGESLKVLATDPNFRPMSMKMLKHAKAGERDELQKMLESYLGDLTKFEFLSAQGAAASLALIEEYIDEVMAFVSGGTGAQEPTEEPTEEAPDAP